MEDSATMRLYKLDSAEEFAWVESATDEDSDYFHQIYGDASRRADDWVAPHFILRTTLGRQNLRIPDLHSQVTSDMFLNDRARAVIEPVAREDVEFLPLRLGDEVIWFMHVVRVIDAIDLEHTERDRSWGSIDPRRWAFREEAIPADVAVFRLPPNQRFIDPYIYTEGLVDTILDAGLTGREFQLIWDSDLDTQPFVPPF
ncbi:hypothetical protein DCE94_09970 [Agromyces badenianii]|nr:hypothetical protein DCE94_09970 [Agromyces badenianii]